jgi:hypothetical protein
MCPAVSVTFYKSAPNNESAKVRHDSSPITLSSNYCRSSSIPWYCLALASAFAAMRSSTFIGFFFGTRAIHTGGKNFPAKKPCSKIPNVTNWITKNTNPITEMEFGEKINKN